MKINYYKINENLCLLKINEKRVILGFIIKMIYSESNILYFSDSYPKVKKVQKSSSRGTMISRILQEYDKILLERSLCLSNITKPLEIYI